MWIVMLLIGSALVLWAIPKIRRIGFYAFAKAVGVLMIDIGKALARLFKRDEHEDNHSKDDYAMVDAMEDIRIAREGRATTEERAKFGSYFEK